MPRTHPMRLLYSLLFLLVACEVPTTTEEPIALETVQEVVPSDTERFLNLNDEWARIARTSVPGFAGIWRTGEGEVAVRLTDVSRAPEARSYISSTLPPRQGESRTVSVRPATYDFDQLNRWFRRLHSLLFDVEGIVSLDIDEVKNLVSIGVADETMVSNVRSRAEELGIPSGAFEVRVGGQTIMQATLQDRVRPPDGGYEIQNVGNGESCTLGWNTFRQGDPVFVTAGHCTPDPDGVDGSSERQPNGGAQIGTEIATATPETGIYMSGWGFWNCSVNPCVVADIAMFEMHDSVSTRVGYIGKPTDYGVDQPGPIQVGGEFRIVETTSAFNVPVGTWLSKVGKSSGWTRGQVTATCVDHVTSTHVIKCEWETDVYVTGGDSGAPVFKWLESDRASLAGMVRGSLADQGQSLNEMVFNPFDFAEWHLGNMDVCATPNGSCPAPPDPIEVEISGPDWVPEHANELCLWQAQTTGGAGSKSYDWTWDGQAQPGSQPYWWGDTGSDGWKWIEVTVTDDSGSDYDAMQVHVDGSTLYGDCP